MNFFIMNFFSVFIFHVVTAFIAVLAKLIAKKIVNITFQ